MKEFTEKHHAFIAAMFYRELTAVYGERGKQAFVLSTWRYAEQRGSRMAQRAIRDGKPLNFRTYRAYGEWTNTQSVKEEGCENRNVPLAYSPDYMEDVTQCPWNTQFRQMGMGECGSLYCSHVDKAVVRGFNPYLVFEMPENLYDGAHCRQILKGAEFDEGQVFQKDPQNVMCFDYHCAHCFKTFAEIAVSVFLDGGKEIATRVLESFEAEYGGEMKEHLEKMQPINFNVVKEA